MADKLEIKRSTYAYYETRTSEPDMETLIKLANLFHTTIDFLIGHQTDENPHRFFYNQTSSSEETILTEREESLLQMFRSIDSAKQELVLTRFYDFLRDAYDQFPNEDTIRKNT